MSKIHPVSLIAGATFVTPLIREIVRSEEDAAKEKRRMECASLVDHGRVVEFPLSELEQSIEEDYQLHISMLKRLISEEERYDMSATTPDGTVFRRLRPRQHHPLKKP